MRIQEGCTGSLVAHSGQRGSEELVRDPLAAFGVALADGGQVLVGRVWPERVRAARVLRRALELLLQQRRVRRDDLLVSSRRGNVLVLEAVEAGGRDVADVRVCRREVGVRRRADKKGSLWLSHSSTPDGGFSQSGSQICPSQSRHSVYR